MSKAKDQDQAKQEHEQIETMIAAAAQAGFQMGAAMGRSRGRHEGASHAFASMRPSLTFNDLVQRRTKCMNALEETDQLAEKCGFNVDKVREASQMAHLFDQKHGAASDNVTVSKE